MPQPPHARPQALSEQHGMGLVELMIGMTIGLLVTATAITALLLVRSLTASTTEWAQMQQQAAYVSRVIGQQIRHAGGRTLRTAATPDQWAELDDNAALHALPPLQGSDQPSSTEYTLTLRQQNAAQTLYTSKTGVFESKVLLRNCLGENPGVVKAVALSSSFKRVNNNLVCAGTAAAQILISDVTDFQVRYLVEHFDGTASTFQYVHANAIHTPQQWLAVRAIEVCLEITGSQPTPSLGSTYRKCDGSLAARAERLQMVVRSHYHTSPRLWTLAP